MINSGDGGSTKKRNIVSRRMFILTAAKVIIFGGIITRLFSLGLRIYKPEDQNQKPHTFHLL